MAVYWCTKLSVRECIDTIVLSNLHVEGGSNDHECLKYTFSQYGSIGIVSCHLKIALYANPSLVFGEEAFAVKLVLEHPKQWQDLVVLSVEVLLLDSCVCAFAFDV
jgi:hypothetical protein